jgi:hypothetical protein
MLTLAANYEHIADTADELTEPQNESGLENVPR